MLKYVFSFVFSLEAFDVDMSSVHFARIIKPITCIMTPPLAVGLYTPLAVCPDVYT